MEEKWSAESLKRARGAERGVDDGYKIIISYSHGLLLSMINCHFIPFCEMIAPSLRRC